MTILTHGALVVPRCDHRLMECMFRNIFRVTSLALHRDDPFFMRKIVGIETGMAGGTAEFFVRRCSKVFIIHEERYGLTVLLHGE